MPRQMIGNIIEALDQEVIQDHFSDEFLSQNKLSSLTDAWVQVHCPQTLLEIKNARKRFIFEEFFHSSLKPN